MIDFMTMARPYAKAAFHVAKEQGSVDAWSDYLANLQAAVELMVQKKVLNNPGIDANAMVALCLACAPKADDAFKQLVHLLAKKRRLRIVPALRKWFEAAKIRDQGLCVVTVESGQALDDAYVKRLAAQLKKRLKQDVQCETSVNPKLLGGIRMRTGDLVMDASLRGRLDRLRQQLLDAAIPQSN